MKALILALFLFPVQSWAGAPCPKKLEERTSPCTASPEEQAEITGYIDAGLSAHVAFENDLEWGGARTVVSSRGAGNRARFGRCVKQARFVDGCRTDSENDAPKRQQQLNDYATFSRKLQTRENPSTALGRGNGEPKFILLPL